MSKKQTTRDIRHQTITNIQNRLMNSHHGEFYVTTDFVHLQDAVGRSGARRALVAIAKMGPYGCREVFPGHWQAQGKVDALTETELDMALQSHADTIGELARNVSYSKDHPESKMHRSDMARLEALTESVQDIHNVWDARDGWSRVYLDDDTKTLTPDLPSTGTLLTKLSGLVTWTARPDGGEYPRGKTPEAQAYVEQLITFTEAQRKEE